MKEFPKPVTKKCHEVILEQMNNYIYQIAEKEVNEGIAIFCKIKNENENIPVLISSYKTINDKFIENNKGIKIKINNKLKEIEFGDTKYINKEHDLTILEIKDKMDKKINFVELDEALSEKNYEKFYNEETIYIIDYKNDMDMAVSYGLIKDIHKSKFLFSSIINSKSKGLPIFNLFNNKLIGIYQNSSGYYNKGIFLKSIINEFINKYKYNQNKYNQINILIKIDKEDINKEIYFLDNYEFEDNQGKQHFHDNLKELKDINTELYINNKKYEYSKCFIPEKEGEYKINLKFNINLSNCRYMFAGCEKIKKIDFISFHSKYVTNMKYMFYKCNNLKIINNLFSFDTSNTINMSYMFSECKNLNNLELSSFNTEKVKSLNNMFSECNNLYSLDLSNFDTLNLIDMSYILYECNHLTNLSLFSSETKNVINMSYAFYGCYNLKNINLSSFNTKNVIDMSYMFFDCHNLENLNLSSFNTQNVKNISYMFFGCSNLNNLDLSSFNITNVTDMSNILNRCNNLKDINSKFLKKNEIF